MPNHAHLDSMNPRASSCRNPQSPLPFVFPLLAALVLCGLPGCGEAPNRSKSKDAPPERSQSAVSSSDPEKVSPEIKQAALEQLLPVIRRFDRAKVAYEHSEESYLERLYLWTLSFSVLEMRSTPGVFAGDLPEHDLFYYSAYIESAETLLSDVTVYLKRYAEERDPGLELLQRKQEEASNAVVIPFSGSGSRLQDAIASMRSPEFQAVVNAANPRLAEVGKIGGKHMVETFGTAASKAMQFLNQVLQSQSNKQY